MIGYILFLIARTAAILLLPFGLLYTIVKRVRNLKSIGKYFFDIAYVFDVLINVIYGEAFDDVFRNKGGYRFGSRYDTISKGLGVNKLRGTETQAWAVVSKFLNWLDKDHVEKAARK